METETFAKFVESQQEGSDDAEVDWAGVRDKWLKDLDSLYTKVAHFLEEYISAGSISYDFSEIELTEPDIGTYRAKRMNIKIGRQHVSLLPIGTMLIGFKGRVDALGSAGRGQMLLVDEGVRSAADLFKVTVSIGGVPRSSTAQKSAGSLVWKILTNTAQRQFVDLSKEAFFDLLMEIANG